MINDNKSTNLFANLRMIMYGEPKVGKTTACADPSLKPLALLLEDPAIAMAGIMAQGIPEPPWIDCRIGSKVADPRFNSILTRKGHYFTTLLKELDALRKSNCVYKGKKVRFVYLDSATALGELEYPDVGPIRSDKFGPQWRVMGLGFKLVYQALAMLPVHTCIIGHPMFDEDSAKFELAIPGSARRNIISQACSIHCLVVKNERKPGKGGDNWPGNRFHFADYGQYPAGAQLGAYLPGRMEASIPKVIATLNKRYEESKKKGKGKR